VKHRIQTEGKYAAQRRQQAEMAALVSVRPITVDPTLIAGLDVAYDLERGVAFASAVLYSLPGLELLESTAVSEKIAFPYITGLLSFRELPPLLSVLGKLSRTPELLLVDGQGICHPRRLGLASHLGVMERQLEKSIQYARDRVQYGQPIGKYQSVANRIVDMKIRLETARLLLYKVAWLKKMGKSAVMEAAMAKLYLSECFVDSGLDAIRTLGGYGYMTEFEIERDLRDAIGGTIYSGTSDIQRNIISRLLGL